ncbi:MAG: efflux RND transporter periplasmic adaptor subunit [Sedimentisphaerales bacterium]|nr:efflux RND transporter periplasmic adaptor subunit [Sedimentisphaerales bacterium]
MRKYFKTTIAVVIILTIIVVFVVQKFLRKKGPDSQAGTVVRMEEVQPADLQEFVSAPGEIEPKTKVDISAKVSARVVELPFEEGQEVTAGDPNTNPPIPPSILVRLDSKDAESRLRRIVAGFNSEKAQIEVQKANLAASEANLKGTEVTLEQYLRDFERQEQLLESQDISQSTFDEAKQRYEQLRAQYESEKQRIEASKLQLIVSEYNLEAQRAAVEEAQEALSYTTITAPMDGIITRINVEVGMVVTGTIQNPGTVIMTVADLSKMLIVAQVDEADIGKLAVGQRAEVRVQAYWDQRFEGVVDNIALTHDMSRTGAKYYRTEILLQGDVSKLYSGLTADVDIFTEKYADIIKVPSQAVLSRKVDDLPLDIREGNPNVDMAKNDCMVVYRILDAKTVVTPVTIGPSDMTHIIIRSGLNPGDKVVVGPYKVLDGIKHDQKVRDEREVEAEKKAKEKEKEDDKTATDKDKQDDNNKEEDK